MNRVFWQRVRIVMALMQRDLKVMRGTVVSSIINGGIFIALQAFIYGYLFPIIGMPVETATSMCVGQFIIAIDILSFLIAENIAFDLSTNRYIDYQLSLPLPKKWLFGKYLASFFIETLSVTIPIFIFGSLILGPHLNIIHTSWQLLIVMYLATCLFFTLLFFTLSIGLSLRWFMDRMWSCILAPLMLFSSLFFDWHKVYEFSPTLGTLFLCNPITYISEGLRHSIIGGPNHIATILCLPVIILSIISLSILLAYSINKRLDPV